MSCSATSPTRSASTVRPDALTSATGVNVDEESSKLNELQQQYSTAAQMFAVLNQMFDALITAARAT